MGELVPDEAREAACLAFDEASDLDWQERAVDAALDAAAPLIAAAATSRLREAIEALCDEMGCRFPYVAVSDLRRALASPVSDDTPEYGDPFTADDLGHPVSDDTGGTTP